MTGTLLNLARAAIQLPPWHCLHATPGIVTAEKLVVRLDASTPEGIRNSLPSEIA